MTICQILQKTPPISYSYNYRSREMFPFELSFQAGEEQVEDQMIYHHQQDPIVDTELVAATINFSAMPAPPPAPAGRGRGRGRGPGHGEDDKRKIQHREIERQRRQEMSTLFSSLRSLLPLDYVKGKRSTSDHIAESAKYIKQLEGRIKELGDTRDQLLTESSSSSTASIINHDAVNKVEVFLVSAGVQVQISCREDGPILSTSIRVLLQAGLDVVSCVTNRLAGGALLHNIHCQLITDVAWGEIDVQQLQHTLYQVLSSEHTNTSTL